MGLAQEDDADPFEEFFFDGDLVLLEAIDESLKVNEEHPKHIV